MYVGPQQLLQRFYEKKVMYNRVNKYVLDGEMASVRMLVREIGNFLIDVYYIKNTL